MKNELPKTKDNLLASFKELEKKNKVEIIKAIEELFINLRAFYPDMEILLRAGAFVRYSKCDIDEYLINFLNTVTTPFEEALIYWFLCAYWVNRKDLDQKYTLMLFEKVKYMKENLDYGNKTACLLVLIELLNINLLTEIDATKTNEILEFLKYEYDEQSKSESLKMLALYSKLQKVLKL